MRQLLNRVFLMRYKKRLKGVQVGSHQNQKDLFRSLLAKSTVISVGRTFAGRLTVPEQNMQSRYGHALHTTQEANNIVRQCRFRRTFYWKLLLMFSDLPNTIKRSLNKKYLKADFAYRNVDYMIDDELQDGGTDVETLGGSHLRIYRDKSAYGGVPDLGPETMYIYSFTKATMVPLATPDIQPLNGVVHALNYNYVLGGIRKSGYR